MTPAGKSYVTSRLVSCPDLASLAKVWGQLGLDYQRDPDVIALKDQLKAGFSGVET